ncbi:MAG: hypothetical protein HY720_23530 [Planctomycetes bacterium]|nr:hypothetical protein [Planctomycetota bacterium]
MCYLQPGYHADEGKRFRIHEWLGFGGRSPHYQLFTAEDKATGELVMVKVFPTAEWRTGEIESELDRIRDLEHETLIRPLDFGPVASESYPFYTGSLAYVAEPIQSGMNLERFLEEEPPPEKVEPIFSSILDGLRFLAAEWVPCDVPAREIVLARPDLARWSLVGAERCGMGSLPNVVRTISHRYPALAASC